MTETPSSYVAPAVTVCFSVNIDKENLGSFNSCDGLGMEVVIEQREEGGTNGFVWQLPTRIKFSNVKLSRPICDDTGLVIRWLSSLGTDGPLPNAHIVAMSVEQKPVAEWTLLQVVPVRWTGPSLNLDSPKVATETLELAHHGFGPIGATS